MNVGKQDKQHETLLRYQKSLDCVHCGLCLPVCPTYQITHNESLSPRGRIYLMRGLAENRLKADASFRPPMESCLQCRACETVCPSGVEFGRMMEIARAELHRNRRPSWKTRIADYLLRRVVPNRARLSRFTALTFWFQRLGLIGLIRSLRLARLFGTEAEAMLAQLPKVPATSERRPLDEVYHSSKPNRGRIGFLKGCVASELFPSLNRRSVEVLRDAGFDVIVPETQTCCGALQAHAGDAETAAQLARKNIVAFEEAEVEFVVSNAAGCGSGLKDYEAWLADDAEWADRARELSQKAVDITAFLFSVAHEPRPWKATRKRAVYDAPCHLHHAQGCQTEVPLLLEKVPGLELLPLERAEDCCGGAGIYNISHPELSTKQLDAKLDALQKSKAEILITGNPGCSLQWQKGIAERGLDIEVRHPIEFL